MNLLDIMHSEDGTFAPRLAEVATRKLVTDVTEQMTPVALGNVSLAGGEGAWRVLRSPQALREVRHARDGSSHSLRVPGTPRLVHGLQAEGTHDRPGASLRDRPRRW